MDEGEGEKPAGSAGLPGVIVFEVTTARRVGAQLRYNGGPRLDEVQYALRMLTEQEARLASDY
ncbi:hypothetical protein [Micromonospora chersina]|uniref:hypothetical protein n=1 Tax=Micromonospora chersina TaxID=47854 RepID=UPI0033ACC607